MVKSNVITFTVTAPPVTITNNTITAPKTTLTVGEIITITGTLTFSAALPSSRGIDIKVYVNDTFVKGIQITAPSGSTGINYNFNISFDAAGTYSLYTDANFM